jgi:hypothetical protein
VSDDDVLVATSTQVVLGCQHACMHRAYHNGVGSIHLYLAPMCIFITAAREQAVSFSLGSTCSSLLATYRAGDLKAALLMCVCKECMCDGCVYV